MRPPFGAGAWGFEKGPRLPPTYIKEGQPKRKGHMRREESDFLTGESQGFQDGQTLLYGLRREPGFMRELSSVYDFPAAFKRGYRKGRRRAGGNSVHMSQQEIQDLAAKLKGGRYANLRAA